MKSKAKKEQIVFALFFMAAAFAFMAAGCASIDPFRNEMIVGSKRYWASDSAMFQIIGKGWSQGLLPYIDLWDSKGPWIFFVNMLGYSLTGTRAGVFILEVINWFVVEIFLYKIFRLNFNKISSAGLTAVVLFFASYFCKNQGNNVEDYCMPFITAAMYLTLKFFNEAEVNKAAEHKAGYAFVYGMAFAVSLLTRVTNAIAICVAVGMITLYLISKKKWINLLKNMGAFIGGAAVLCLPFVIYYASKGYLYELAYGTLIYNVSYYVASDNMFFQDNFFILIIRLTACAAFCVISALMFFSRKEWRWRGFCYFAMALITIVYFTKSQGYNHYLIIAIPYSAMEIVELKRYIEWLKAKKGSNVVQKIFTAGLCLLTAFHMAVAVLGINANLKATKEYYERQELQLLDMIPKEDLKDSFVAYNVNCFVYLKLDCMPCYKYISYQDWAEGCTPETTKDIRDIYSTCKAKWILFRPNEEQPVPLINDILEENYEIAATESIYTLYKLK